MLKKIHHICLCQHWTTEVLNSLPWVEEKQCVCCSLQLPCFSFFPTPFILFNLTIFLSFPNAHFSNTHIPACLLQPDFHSLPTFSLLFSHPVLTHTHTHTRTHKRVSLSRTHRTEAVLLVPQMSNRPVSQTQIQWGKLHKVSVHKHLAVFPVMVIITDKAEM